MGRQPVHLQLTAADFGWLEVSNYARLDAGNLSLWSQTLLDRVELNRFLKNGDREYVAEYFEKLKSAPLTSLGFKRTPKPQHQASQPAIKLLTLGHFLELNDALLPVESDETGKDELPIDYARIIDDMLRQDKTGAWQRYAHLKVDLHATDNLLKQNFADWLAAWRADNKLQSPPGNTLEQKAVTWAWRYVVPYFDMQMYAWLNQKEIPRPVIAEKFARKIPALIKGQVDLQEKPSSSALDELRKDLPRIFSSATVDIFLNAVADQINTPTDNPK